MIAVDDFDRSQPQAPERSRWYCEQLERGQIFLFRDLPYDLPPIDRDFLISQRASSSRIHKNVSYRPEDDELRGLTGQDSEQVHEIMRRYSTQVVRFISRFLSPYAVRLALDYASFRPLEEAGRNLPLHKRNDLLHVDAFPSRPTGGGRILRVFTNISINKPRVWITTEDFRTLASRYAAEAGLAKYHGSLLRNQLAEFSRVLPIAALKRSPYDSFMLRFHDYLKENNEFQQHTNKIRLEFPPLSTWLVFTDGCPHAVLSGQFALEQTFIIPLNALVSPNDAPVRVLESLSRRKLAA